MKQIWKATQATFFILGFLACLVLGPPLAVSPAYSQGGAVQVPLRCALINRSSNVATGGTAVTIAAYPPRSYLFIQNPSTLTQQNIAAAESLFIDPTGAAAVVNGASSIEILSGNSFIMESTTIGNQAISINATTSGHRFIAKEC